MLYVRRAPLEPGHDGRVGRRVSGVSKRCGGDVCGEGSVDRVEPRMVFVLNVLLSASRASEACRLPWLRRPAPPACAHGHEIALDSCAPFIELARGRHVERRSSSLDRCHEFAFLSAEFPGQRPSGEPMLGELGADCHPDILPVIDSRHASIARPSSSSSTSLVARTGITRETVW
ncbi:hypothetical protein [Microbacterium azadirachtae]|nr:hypothetical protein [Microbacterium azadirachtae]